MITEMIMPKIGYSMEEGTIVQWLKNEGDPITEGEPVLEISSDKANMEIEAPASGYLRKIMTSVGETVPVSQIIGLIGELHDPLPGEAETQAETVTVPETSPLVSETAAKTVTNGTLTAEATDDEMTAVAAVIGERPKLSPRARKFANENGIDPKQLPPIAGTGLNGMVVERDLHRFMPGPTTVAAPGAAIMKPSRNRQIIAKKMTESAREIPQFCVGVQVDATAIGALRERLNREAERQNKPRISMTVILVKCVAKALADHMNVNVSWHDEAIVAHPELNIGVAMSTEAGLVVPVLRQPQGKGLFEIAAELSQLNQKAKSNKLTPAEMSGGTFTISNLGMFAVDSFRAIINPPESGILAVGRINRQPVATPENEIVIKPMMWLNLTVDHRVLDGSDAARLLESMKNYIEIPELLLS